jgi:uncharacterized membrane protein
MAHPRTYRTDRLNALSDGLFAIVLTLLVLEIRLPEPPGPGEQLLSELAANAPDLVGWLVSFLVLARVWVVHHAVTASMERCHLGTIILNFGLLAAVSLTPFTSSLVGAYEFAQDWATAIFSIQLGLVGLALGLLAVHVAREPHLRSPEPEDLSWHWKHHLWVVPATAVVAATLAVAHHPLTAFGVWTLEFAAVLVLAVRVAWPRSVNHRRREVRT